MFVALEIMSVALYGLAGIDRARLREPGGGAQVLRDRGVRVGLLPLRHRAGLRRHRQHLARARHARARRGRPAGAAARRAGRGAAAGGLRLQGRERAVPHVDARRLRGRADHGHGLHVRGREGGRLRRAAARLRLRPREPGGPLAAAGGGARGRHDGGRQPGGARPDQPEADAGLLLDRARGLPDERARRAARRSPARPSSSIWWPTPP